MKVHVLMVSLEKLSLIHNMYLLEDYENHVISNQNPYQTIVVNINALNF